MIIPYLIASLTPLTPSSPMQVTSDIVYDLPYEWLSHSKHLPDFGSETEPLEHSLYDATSGTTTSSAYKLTVSNNSRESQKQPYINTNSFTLLRQSDTAFQSVRYNQQVRQNPYHLNIYSQHYPRSQTF